MKDPAFDEDAVRALATAESFARGRDYLRRGAVSGPERRGNRLTAEVEGSEFAPYAVTIELHDGGVAGSRCSCLYDWGGVCKHVVAVLVKYLEAPSAVAQRPSLDDMLHGLDREALAALLIKRAGQDPALALWLEAELATGTPEGGSAGGRRTTVDRSRSGGRPGAAVGPHFARARLERRSFCRRRRGFRGADRQRNLSSKPATDAMH